MRTTLLLSFMALALTLFGQATDVDLNEGIAQNKSDGETFGVYQAQSIISYYKVTKGDNLKKIASRNDVSEENIKIWNNLESGNVYAGMELKIQKIEYILIESPQFKEPELLTITVNEDAASDIMANYIDKLDKNTEVQNIYDSKEIYQEIIMYAENIVQDYQEVMIANNNNLWNRLSNATNVAFVSAKSWSGSLVGKLKPKKDTGTLPIEENVGEEVESINENTIENIAQFQDSISLENVVDDQPSYALEDNWKKIYHKVKIGETVAQIATRYNVSRDDIIAWNNLSCGMAKVRQRLLIYIPKDYAFVPNHRAVYYQ